MIRTVLTKFQDLSGLYPNPNKSDIFLSGTLNAERDQIIRILGFKEGELPMKYLRLPLLSSRLKAVYCKGLVDRITSKVRHWTMVWTRVNKLVFMKIASPVTLENFETPIIWFCLTTIGTLFGGVWLSKIIRSEIDGVKFLNFIW